MPTRYLTLTDNYPNVIKALKFPLDLSPLESFETTLDHLNTDLPRTHFFSDRISFSQFSNKVREQLAFGRHYLQGDLDANLIAKLLFLRSKLFFDSIEQYQQLSNACNTESKQQTQSKLEKQKDKVEQVIKEITFCDNTGLRLAYLTDQNQLNALAISYLKSSPDVFSIALFENITARPERRKVHLFADFRLFPEEGVNNKQFKCIDLPSIKTELAKHLKNERLLRLLSEVIVLNKSGEMVAGINPQEVDAFKKGSLPGHNHQGLDELAAEKQATEYAHQKTLDKLSLLAKAVLNSAEWPIFEKAKHNNIACNKLILSFNELQRILSPKTLKALKRYSQKKQTLLKAKEQVIGQLNLAHEQSLFRLSKPFSKRYQKELIVLGLTTLFAITTSICLLVLPSLASLITLSAISFLTLSALLGCSYSFFQTSAMNKPYFSEKHLIERNHQRALHSLEDNTITELKTENQEEVRVHILELLSASNIDKPSELIEDYLKP
jgi:hypothetical protein